MRLNTVRQDEMKKTTTWEKIKYWPMGKAFYETSKGALLIELNEIFWTVSMATMGGIFLAYGALTKDYQGLLFTYSRARDRYELIMVGVVLILFALGIGIVRRIILSPPTGNSKNE
jgi:hypothetical protein